MRFISKYPKDAEDCLAYTKKLIEQKKTIEVISKTERTPKQNKYFHLILGMVGLEFGYTSDEVNSDFKIMNSDIFEYEKNGRSYYKSSSKVTTKEMTIAIERFRKYYAENGFYIPSANEDKMIEHYLKEIENNKQWL